jgi:hypothetical protein
MQARFDFQKHSEPARKYSSAIRPLRVALRCQGRAPGDVWHLGSTRPPAATPDRAGNDVQPIFESACCPGEEMIEITLGRGALSDGINELGQAGIHASSPPRTCIR